MNISLFGSVGIILLDGIRKKDKQKIELRSGLFLNTVFKKALSL